MKTAGTVVLWICGIALTIAVSVGLYFVGRQINYKLSYEDMVRATVIEMVKEDALR